MTANTQNHWNDIYTNKSDQQLGWYEKDGSKTLAFIQPANITDNTQVFLSGAGTSQLADELAALGCQLIANDISQAALNRLSERIGKHNTTYLLHDISTPLPTLPKVDVWIDRAVLHFLLTEQEIACYFNNINQTVVVDGFVLLAEFSTTGAKKCAGLELHQYSVEEMQARLGKDFTLIASEEHVFINPLGDKKPYIYGLFQRISKTA